jgi:GntR family transcriptional repressor for pyruvate dehydrogenase complex
MVHTRTNPRPAAALVVDEAKGWSPLAATVNLADRVAASLRERVLTGGFAPGARLPAENAMAASFGVSRPVVREAVSRLKSEGLLVTRQGSGVFVHADALVRPLTIIPDAGQSLQAVLEIVELRRAIETESAALAARRRTPAEIETMRGALRDLDAAVARGRDGVEEDVRFHRSIAEATGNRQFLAVLAFLDQYLHGATFVTRANEAMREDFARQVREEHHAVLAAIEDGSAEEARRKAARHMSNATKRMRLADPQLLQRVAPGIGEMLGKNDVHPAARVAPARSRKGGCR